MIAILYARCGSWSYLDIEGDPKVIVLPLRDLFPTPSSSDGEYKGVDIREFIRIRKGVYYEI